MKLDHEVETYDSASFMKMDSISIDQFVGKFCCVSDNAEVEKVKTWSIMWGGKILALLTFKQAIHFVDMKTAKLQKTLLNDEQKEETFSI